MSSSRTVVVSFWSIVLSIGLAECSDRSKDLTRKLADAY